MAAAVLHIVEPSYANLGGMQMRALQESGPSRRLLSSCPCAHASSSHKSTTLLRHTSFLPNDFLNLLFCTKAATRRQLKPELRARAISNPPCSAGLQPRNDDASRTSPGIISRNRPQSSFLRYSPQRLANISLGGLLGSSSKRGRRTSVVAKALGEGGPGGEPDRRLGKFLGYATWGLVIWSAVTGQLNWFFEGLTALTLTILAIPVLLGLVFVGVVAWANNRQIEGPCPTCGAQLSFVKWGNNMIIVADQSLPQQIPANEDNAFNCPNCQASVKVEDKKIVRGRPSFDDTVTFDFGEMFGSRKQPSNGRSSAADQPIVDIEAEVLDKD